MIFQMPCTATGYAQMECEKELCPPCGCSPAHREIRRPLPSGIDRAQYLRAEVPTRRQDPHPRPAPCPCSSGAVPLGSPAQNPRNPCARTNENGPELRRGYELFEAGLIDPHGGVGWLLCICNLTASHREKESNQDCFPLLETWSLSQVSIFPRPESPCKPSIWSFFLAPSRQHPTSRQHPIFPLTSTWMETPSVNQMPSPCTAAECEPRAARQPCPSGSCSNPRRSPTSPIVSHLALAHSQAAGSFPSYPASSLASDG